jgi:uncharacterized protein (TIGR02466 family)
MADVRFPRGGAVEMSGLKGMGSGVLFGAPVLEYLWPDGAELNRQLRQSILEHARQHTGRKQTNVGGWHSETGRLEFCGAAGERLVHHIYEMTNEATGRLYATNGRPPEASSWTLTAWANINRRGHYNNIHTHPSATWSGVYYVDHGESNPTADRTSIQLYDPNPARTNVFFPDLPIGTFRFRPEPGLMILFPSYVPHDVPPHQGDRPRISIAFNLRKEPFP